MAAFSGLSNWTISLDFPLNISVDWLVLKVKANHVRVLQSSWVRRMCLLNHKHLDAERSICQLRPLRSVRMHTFPGGASRPCARRSLVAALRLLSVIGSPYISKSKSLVVFACGDICVSCALSAPSRRLLREISANRAPPFGARSVQLINGGSVFVKVVLFTRKFLLGNNSPRVSFVLKR